MPFSTAGTWPRTKALYCYPLDVEPLPDEPEIVERVGLRSCRRPAATIDLILDGRPGEEQCHRSSIDRNARSSVGVDQMRRSFAVLRLAAIVTPGALALGGAPGGLATPDDESPSAPSHGGFISDGRRPLDQDNRKGRVEPSARQRALAAAVEARARFNNLGTPRMLASTAARSLQVCRPIPLPPHAPTLPGTGSCSA